MNVINIVTGTISKQWKTHSYDDIKNFVVTNKWLLERKYPNIKSAKLYSLLLKKTREDIALENGYKRINGDYITLLDHPPVIVDIAKEEEKDIAVLDYMECLTDHEKNVILKCLHMYHGTQRSFYYTRRKAIKKLREAIKNDLP